MNVRELLGRVGENLSVGRSFGPAYERDGALIIPVALVAGGGGGGEGTSGAETGAAERDGAPAQPDGPSTGSGGGFGGVVMPVGVYVVKDEQVRWVPAINVTVVAVMGLATLRTLIRAVSRSRRH